MRKSKFILGVLRGFKHIFDVGPSYKARNGKVYDRKETPEEFLTRTALRK